MGSYSYFADEDIEVKDWEGLMSFFEEWDKYQKQEKWENKLEYTNKKEMIKKNDEGKEYLTFENWDNIKLISYYYEETCIFLTLIAKYVEGRVEWDFENSDEAGHIDFEDGICNISTGQMEYHEWEAKKNIDINKLNPRLKKLMILGSL